METPIPVNDPQPTGWRPTASTTLALVAGAVGQFVASALRHFGVWDMDAETQGSLTVITMALVSFIHPDGGRK